MTRATAWILGIVGAIASFLGLFILFGGEDQSIGFGGDLSWTVGEISSAWGYGLLLLGIALLAATVTIVVRAVRHPETVHEESDFAGLMVHAAVFIVVNAFLWVQDFAAGGGLEYAYWVTIPWGVGLIAHATTYMIEARHIQGPKQPLPH